MIGAYVLHRPQSLVFWRIPFLLSTHRTLSRRLRLGLCVCWRLQFCIRHDRGSIRHRTYASLQQILDDGHRDRVANYWICHGRLCQSCLAAHDYPRRPRRSRYWYDIRPESAHSVSMVRCSPQPGERNFEFRLWFWRSIVRLDDWRDHRCIRAAVGAVHDGNHHLRPHNHRNSSAPRS